MFNNLESESRHRSQNIIGLEALKVVLRLLTGALLIDLTLGNLIEFLE